MRRNSHLFTLASVLLVSGIFLFQNCTPAKLYTNNLDTPSVGNIQVGSVAPAPDSANTTSSPSVTSPATALSLSGSIRGVNNTCVDTNDPDVYQSTKISPSTCYSSPTEIWNLVSAGNVIIYYYYLISAASNDCMTVNQGSQAENTPVTHQPCQSLPYQMWNYSDLGNSTFKLIDVHSGKCLRADSTNGNMTVVTCTDGAKDQIFNWGQ